VIEQRGYYGSPVLKEPVWTPEVPVYFWLGGLAGMSALLAFGARLVGNDRLARTSLFTSFLAMLGCPPLLISDLGRPERFYNMLRVMKPTSPMSIGSWVLTGFGGALGGAVVAEVLGTLQPLGILWPLGILRPLGRLAELTAAALGLPLATYTAVLIADTSVPVWHRARYHLPFVFAGSAAASAGAAASALVPSRESGPARLLAVFGSVLELAAVTSMERSLGPEARHYRAGPASRPAMAARVLTGTGAALMALAGRRRLVAVAAGTMILGGSLAERLAVLRAGPSSARETLGDNTIKAEPGELGRPARPRSLR
jgi:formate-dependent nitrite reductase membrane component NrfD